MCEDSREIKDEEDTDTDFSWLEDETPSDPDEEITLIEF
jgi:hypothetical protein